MRNQNLGLDKNKQEDRLNLFFEVLVFLLGCFTGYPLQVLGAQARAASSQRCIPAVIPAALCIPAFAPAGFTLLSGADFRAKNDK